MNSRLACPPRAALAAFFFLVACGQPGTKDAAPVAVTPATSAPIVPPGGAASLSPAPAASGAAEPEDDEPAETAPFPRGAAAFETVKKAMLTAYYDEGLREDDLYRAAVQGMLERADPRMHRWNKLLGPAELSEVRNDLKGEIVGIGAVIKYDAASGHTDVVGAIPGSPAERAGLGPGDTIVTVNGRLFKGLTLRDVVAEIRGKAGEPVALSVLRGDKLIAMTIVRDVVAYDAVTSASLPNDLGYVRIRSFSEKTPAGARAALVELERRGAKALVVDLRGNEGGGFEQAVATAELFVPRGAGIVTLRKRGAVERVVSKGEPVLAGVKVSVLVDGSTSSGAELVAGALVEGRGAQVIGARTRGKWSVQMLDELPGGWAYKFTSATFETPSGKSYDGRGLTPDVEVAMDPKQIDRAQVLDPVARLAADVQLRAAALLVAPR